MPLIIIIIIIIIIIYSSFLLHHTRFCENIFVVFWELSDSLSRIPRISSCYSCYRSCYLCYSYSLLAPLVECTMIKADRSNPPDR